MTSIIHPFGRMLRAVRRHHLFLTLFLGCLFWPAHASDNHARSVQLVIPFGPGGGTDLIARIIQPKLAQELGQNIVIVNRPGAGGVIATSHVAQSKPDGQTLLLSWDTHTINSIAIKNLPYDIFKDFEPVTLLVRVPLIMGAYAGLPAGTLQEFVTLAKNNPRKYNFGSIGVGSSNRLHGQLLNSLAGIEVVHVPYGGGGAAIAAIRSGEVAYGFFSHGALRSFLESGQIKPLGVTGAKRLPALPAVPTMLEQGFKGFELYSWVGIYAAASTPKPTIERLNRAFVNVLKDEEVASRLKNLSIERVGSTPAELSQFQRIDYERWRRFAEEQNIRFE